jgi:hypothetical protein
LYPQLNVTLYVPLIGRPMAAVFSGSTGFPAGALAGGDARPTDGSPRSQVALGNANVFAKLCLASGGEGLFPRRLHGGQCPPYITQSRALIPSAFPSRSLGTRNYLLQNPSPELSETIDQNLQSKQVPSFINFTPSNPPPSLRGWRRRGVLLPGRGVSGGPRGRA